MLKPLVKAQVDSHHVMFITRFSYLDDSICENFIYFHEEYSAEPEKNIVKCNNGCTKNYIF